MVTQQTLAGRNSTTVKSHNLSTILLALLRHPHISRVDLAKMTGLSNTTITNLITELLVQGIVTEEGTTQLQRRRGAGRPRTSLQLVPDARHAIGVHIGVGRIRVALTDLKATVLHYRSFTHPLDKSAEEVLGETLALVETVIQESGVVPQNIIGVGVGASGLVNPETGCNLMAPNLGWSNVPIRDWFTRHLSLPVIVDNNVRAMALGEAMFGAAQNVRVLAFVYARHGVGAGFVVDGQLFRGSGAGAGEIGHTTVMLDQSEPCRCGNRGCLEPLVSEPPIVAQAIILARQNGHDALTRPLLESAEPTIEQVFTAARAGSPVMRALLEERACYMGIALANLVNILNPELILLGGIFSQGHDLLLPTVEKTMRQRSFGNLAERVQLKPTTFGQQAGAVGASALALTTFFYQEQKFLQTNLPQR
jgi:glucokinase-like ROK family protein